MSTIWIGGFAITAIKDYIKDAINTCMAKEDDVIDPALNRGQMNFDLIENFSHERELIDKLIGEAVRKWNKEATKKATEEEERILVRKRGEKSQKHQKGRKERTAKREVRETGQRPVR